MRKLEAFLGLRVVTYAVMSNHFHLLVEEPDRAELPSLDRETLLQRLGYLYDRFTVDTVREELDRADVSIGLGLRRKIVRAARSWVVTVCGDLDLDLFAVGPGLGPGVSPAKRPAGRPVGHQSSRVRPVSLPSAPSNTPLPVDREFR